MTVTDLLEALRDSQPRTSVELQTELGVSQAVVSRLVTRAGSRILRLGAGRSTRYTMAVDVFGVQPEVSLFEVGNTGIVQEIGSLRQSAARAYIVAGDDQSTGSPAPSDPPRVVLDDEPPRVVLDEEPPVEPPRSGPGGGGGGVRIG